MVAAIELDRLTRSYGSARGVIDLDLVVEPGEVFGFLGPNGAGKTTTIRVLLDLLRPTSGRARVLGLDSRDDAVEIHRRVGYLGGDQAFHERLTVGDELRWLASVRGRGGDAIDGLAHRLDLDLSRPIRDLSRGNRQKVGLVQALMHRPEVLILDEPTSGLDPLVQETFHELVREVTAEGRTVFLSSHVLDEVDHLCHRVGIIRDGRLAAVEAVADLRNRAGRIVTIRFATPIDTAPFAALAGVSGVSAAGSALTLRVRGALDPLVKLAATHEVVDLVSSPPPLEEIFLHYYRREGDDGVVTPA